MSDALTSNLKPCPFCGGPAAYCDEMPDWDVPHQCHYIVCTECGASVDFSKGKMAYTVDYLKGECSSHWNRRPPQEATGLQPVRRWNAKYPGISMLEHNGELIRSGFGPYVLSEDYDRVASLLSEAVRMIEGYRRAGFITNPAALEQASDFALRAGNSHHE